MDTVFHKTLGRGTVISKEERYLTVDFSGNMKKFIYPDAFFSHLTYEDEKKQTEILEIIEKKRTEEKNAGCPRYRYAGAVVGGRLRYLHPQRQPCPAQ